MLSFAGNSSPTTFSNSGPILPRLRHLRQPSHTLHTFKFIS
jgi:hypothetical protein